MSYQCKLELILVCLAVLIWTKTYAQEVRLRIISIPVVNGFGSCPSTEDKERAFNEINDQVRPILSDLVAAGQVNPTTEPSIALTTTEQSTDPIYTCDGTPGWRRVVFIDMTDTSYNCPPGLSLTSYSKRTCGRAHTLAADCSSTAFSIGGSEYSRVCGRIKGYQVGDTAAFYGSSYTPEIDDQYVDGVSLTHGPLGNREHIWSFAAGLNEGPFSSYPEEQCVCDSSNGTILPPPFVGNDYFCESGLAIPFDFNDHVDVLFPDDPLWDGQNCQFGSTCCQLNNPPWFTKNLPNPTTDDIELRLCFTFSENIGDTPLELIELYVQ